MLRTTIAIASMIVTAFLTFVVAAPALSGDDTPRFRDNLPARELAPISLSENEAVRVNNILGLLGEDVGITPSSYDQVRVLAETAVGPLYLIPGANGACLFLVSRSACGDPGAMDAPVNAIVTLDSGGQTLVGGGVADESIQRVEVVAGGRYHGVFPVRNGRFSITLDVPGFQPGDGMQILPS